MIEPHIWLCSIVLLSLSIGFTCGENTTKSTTSPTDTLENTTKSTTSPTYTLDPCFTKRCPDGSCVKFGRSCPGEECTSYETKCKDGSCTYYFDPCPGECRSYEKKCNDGCIKSYETCPEPGCMTRRPYKCRTGTGCYSSNDKCDNINDCLDGTDERGCNYPTYTPDSSGSRSSGSWPWYLIPIILISVAVIVGCCACIAKSKGTSGTTTNEGPVIAGSTTGRYSGYTGSSSTNIIGNQSYPTAVPSYPSPAAPPPPMSGFGPTQPLFGVSGASNDSSTPAPSAPPGYFEAMSAQYDMKDTDGGLPSYTDAVSTNKPT